MNLEEGAVIAREMTDVLVLDLVDKGLVTNSVTLWIAYDHRLEHDPSKGTVRFAEATNSSERIIHAVEEVVSEDRGSPYRDPESGNLCQQSSSGELCFSTICSPIRNSRKTERNLQLAILEIKRRYGRNAVMRGSNLLACSTYRERNNQIGGHRA